MSIKKSPPIKVDERLITFDPESTGGFNQIMSKITTGLMIITILLWGVIAVILIT